MSEHDQQVAVVKWFKLQYPQYKDCIIAIPNGSIVARNKSLGSMYAKIKKMEAEGVKKGTSDLFIAVPRRDKHGLWVEMKDVKKTLCSVSKEQREHLDLMNEMGYEAIWCAGFDVAKAAIEVYMSEDKNE